MKPWIALIIAGLLLGIGAYAIGHCRASHSLGTSHSPFLEATRLTRYLSLDTRQREVAEQFRKGYTERLATLCEQHCKLRGQLADHLWEANAHRNEKFLLDQMSRIQADTDAATLALIRETRTVLTPAQREKYDRFVREMLGSPCPTHLHHGDPPKPPNHI